MGKVWTLDHQQLTVLQSQTPSAVKKEITANNLELCIEGRSGYLPCGTRDIADSNFFANAEMNLTINEGLGMHLIGSRFRTNCKES
jgi:hypothetical protein